MTTALLRHVVGARLQLGLLAVLAILAIHAHWVYGGGPLVYTLWAIYVAVSFFTLRFSGRFDAESFPSVAMGCAIRLPLAILTIVGVKILDKEYGPAWVIGGMVTLGIINSFRTRGKPSSGIQAESRDAGQ